ncbi:hypothetical protein PRIPAC_96873 [Pristionchus pacificus]|uniref:Uncharacterized protein n=1 Tax=Pristionchus pacificus TaxID=54126 RepID=A0A454Y7B0_PRIPA|nr:hypothetical protein PRIPAC_96873 [Pristionchus pacificus]|eukprot:PDM63459.1 hypothetical protein PRIPAC_53816 [Pristionchus pacificus]
MLFNAIVLAVLVGCAGANVQCNSCSSNNAIDCSTGQTCQGNYCIYERTTAQNGASTVMRSCASSSFFKYPDESMLQTVNQCERRSINGIDYAVEVCNTGSFCDTQCNTVSILYSSLSAILMPVLFLL